VPLVELEEYMKQKQAEKKTLHHELDEVRAVIDSVNVDRQTIEEYKELKNEMDKYQLEDPIFSLLIMESKSQMVKFTHTFTKN
jgi:chromosome segregation ATPase